MHNSSRHSMNVSVVGYSLLTCLFILLAGLSAQASETVKLALISDLHWGHITNKNQPIYRQNLDKVIAEINTLNVPLVLVAGDLTEKGSKTELTELKQKLSGIKAEVWCVPGNHDVGAKAMATKKSTVTKGSIARFETLIGLANFDRQLANLRVVGINSPALGSGLQSEKAVWALLEKAFTTKADKPTLLLTHYPVFTKKPDEPGGVYWNIEPEPRQRLLTLLQRGGVKAVLSGHTHSPITNQNDGIFYYTTAPVSFGLPAGKQLPGWTLVTISTTGEVSVEPKPIKE